MEKIHEVCNNCTEKHCCRGLCREMNDYLVAKRIEFNKAEEKERK